MEVSTAVFIGITMSLITAIYLKFIHPKLNIKDSRGILFSHGVSSLIGVLANLIYFY